jgi:hypothetical protein
MHISNPFGFRLENIVLLNQSYDEFGDKTVRSFIG